MRTGDLAFSKKYLSLNSAQKAAVDYIYGPLMVIAGPGTGKTHLLAMRVGNILKKTDVLPQNILCLTYTESARTEMQARLVELIGPDAYKVAVHTFHSFGSHVLGSYADKFDQAFGFRPVDDLTRYELIGDVLESLPGNNPLTRAYQGSFLYISDILDRISQFRHAGMNHKLLGALVSADLLWCAKSLTKVRHALGDIVRITPSNRTQFEALYKSLDKPSINKGRIKPLSDFVILDLAEALQNSKGGTKPLTSWKNSYLAKNGNGDWVFKAEPALIKLKALSQVYAAYSTLLKQKKFYDYDDMILRVASKLADDKDLAAELQEQYQFILVDEYQDTSGAQNTLLEQLANSRAAENKPNLMIVSDDDQAIFSFQGAYASNLLDFLNRWRDVKKIVLTDNYRSSQSILDFARQVIDQGEDRLENKYDDLVKILKSNTSNSAKPAFNAYPTSVEQNIGLSKSLAADIKRGLSPSNIAVIAPRHKYLEAIVPFLLDKSIPLSYERREDVLNERHVAQLCQLAKCVSLISKGRLSEVNTLLPELLSYEWWGIPAGWLWEISLTAHKKPGKLWLEIMQPSPHSEIRQIAIWLIEVAKHAQTTPLEVILDLLIGSSNLPDQFSSPFKSYYFSASAIENAQLSYLRILSSLVSLRARLREYKPDANLKLSDFIEFIDLMKKANLKIINDHPLVLNHDAVQIMTAHKAKGLEFEKVYIINADQHTWAEEKGKINKIALSPNLKTITAHEQVDERLRLFYVAATRAKSSLVLSTHKQTGEGKTTLPLGWLQNNKVSMTMDVNTNKSLATKNSDQVIRGLTFDWQTPHFNISRSAKWRDLLKPTLESYQLNPTHLNAFLSVPDGGPKAFLANQILKFPQAMSVSASFGVAAHAVLKQLNSYFLKNKRLPAKTSALRWLKAELNAQKLSISDTAKLLHRGQNLITALYTNPPNFSIYSVAEKDFVGEGVVIGGARLSGKVDRLDFNKTDKTISVIDYKTGPQFKAWPKVNTNVTKQNSFKLHRLHKYRQQLLFYKLLVDGSRSYGGYYKTAEALLVFLEPDSSDVISNLKLSYDSKELTRLKKLIAAIWQKIVNVDLPDTSMYSQDFKGVMDFEDDLIAGKI